MTDEYLIVRCARAAQKADALFKLYSADRSMNARYNDVARAVLEEAAAQLQASKLCGCADAERTYEQLLDYTAELGAELDRQRLVVRAAEALVECDAAKPGLGQSISVWRRQRRELLIALAAAVRAARPEGETE